MTPRAILFTPADKPDLAAKAARSAADAVCLDLEDAVPVDAKTTARANLAPMASTLRAAGKAVFIRVNAEIEATGLDLAALPDGCAGLVLPKARDLTHVALIGDALDRRGGDMALIAMIENAAAAQAFAAAPGPAHARLLGLTLGAEDLAADCGCAPDGPTVAHLFHQSAATAARLRIDLLGWPGSIGAFDDLDGFATLVGRGAAAGAVGGFCIHPKQIPILNAAFAPTAAQIDWAQRVTTALATAGGGVAAVDGRMVDAPVARRAEAVLRRAQCDND